MKNFTLFLLTIISLTSYSQNDFYDEIPSVIINTNDRIYLTQDITITEASIVNYGQIIISEDVTVTFSGSIFNTGKVVLMGCESKLIINGALSGSYNNIDIERNCSECSNLNNVTSIGLDLSYLNIVGTVSYVDLACVTVLPVELLNFDCSDNSLNWSTASEVNSDYFTVHHSYNGIDFTVVDYVNAKGFSDSVVYYKYNYVHEPGYYKLSQTDYDGTTEEFNIVSCVNKYKEVSLISTYDILGQAVTSNTKGLIFELYSNGTVKKIINK